MKSFKAEEAGNKTRHQALGINLWQLCTDLFITDFTSFVCDSLQGIYANGKFAHYALFYYA